MRTKNVGKRKINRKSRLGKKLDELGIKFKPDHHRLVHEDVEGIYIRYWNRVFRPQEPCTFKRFDVVYVTERKRGPGRALIEARNIGVPSRIITFEWEGETEIEEYLISKSAKKPEVKETKVKEVKEIEVKEPEPVVEKSQHHVVIIDGEEYISRASMRKTLKSLVNLYNETLKILIHNNEDIVKELEKIRE